MKFRSAIEAKSIGAPLVRLFVTALARPPAPSELVPPVERLRAGDDLADIAVWLAGTDEFIARHGPDGPPDQHYVRALFWAALGQDPPDLEQDRLLAQPHATRASLLAQVSASAAVCSVISLERHYYGDALPLEDDVAYQLWLEGRGEAALACDGPIPAIAVSLVVMAPPARPDLLAQTLASLAAQTSPHWEALVVTAGSLSTHADPRVRSVAAGASWAESANRAAGAATGSLIGFIEASDQLAPHAVEAAARRVTASPGLRLLYTDEDRIAGDGARFAAILKPGWSPDLGLSGDVLGQLVLFDRAAAMAVGGLAEQAGAFALLDLALRLTADAPPDAVAHEPAILFHRGRASAGRPAPFPHSRASNGLPELDGVIDRFLARHRPGLQRGCLQRDGQVWPAIAATLPSPAPRVSVIVLAGSRPQLLADSLSGLLGGTDYPDLEILIALDGSTAPDMLAIIEHAATDPRVRMLREAIPTSIDRAAAQATGEVLVLLGSGVSVQQPGWLRAMVAHAMRPGVGIVGARLVAPDGRLAHGGFLLGPRGAVTPACAGAAADDPGYLAQVAVLRDVSAVSGACLALRRSLFHDLGGLAGDRLTAFSDVDLCLRARDAGHRVLWDPAATLVQHGAVQDGLDTPLEQVAQAETERAALRRRWPDATEHDPFLNPALRAVPGGLVLRAPAQPTADADWEVQRELAGLRRALHQAQEAADRLHRAWPRAELQRLKLDLAETSAAADRLAAERQALAARLGELPPKLFALALRLRVIPRLWRLAMVVARLPRRRKLLQQRRADHAVIAASPLFDAPWYRAAAMAGDPATDPVSHYIWHGAPASLPPHPLFDAAWYAARNPGIGPETPFADFIRRGMAAGEDPHPLFDTPYYLSQAPEAAGQALLHFSQSPPGNTRSPTRLFSPVDYPEGLAHWAHLGAAADRDPHALFATGWYRRTHLGGDTARNPLAHWVREGAAAGLPTNPYGLDPVTVPVLPAPGPTPSVSIIVPRGATPMDTSRTLYALVQQASAARFEVILTGSGPAPGFGDALRTAPDRRSAITAARGAFLVFLGSGAVTHAGWLAALLDTVADPAIGLVGSKTLARDGSLRSAGATIAGDGRIRHTTGGDPAHPRHAFARAVDAVDAGAMLVRRAAWDTSGGLDDGYQTDDYAGADLAFTLRERGWRVMLQPASMATLPDARPAPGDGDGRRLRARWAAALSLRSPAGTLRADWLAAERRILVLTDDGPALAGSPAADAILRALRPGTRMALHALADGPDTAGWERRGLEILRRPVVFDAWLADHGAALDEVWSFRTPATVPVELLLRWTGARLLQASGETLPPWCDGTLERPPARQAA